MKKTFLLLFALLPMMLSAQNLTPKRHHNKWLYGYWGEKKNGKEGFVIKPKFEKAHPFVGEYAFVRQNGLWGIIGKDGEFVVSPKYDKASEPCNGITIVTLGGKYGLVNDSKEILRVEYENIATYEKGYKLKNRGLYGLADASGKIVLEVKSKEMLSLKNSLFAVYTDKWEFVNSEGKVVERPNNVLLYTSNNGKTIDRGEHIGKIVYNTCHNGQGIMVFDKPITSIGDSAFYNCGGLTSITIPNSVTTIGNSAFSDCDNLTSITIPNSVTEIGSGAFGDCTSLTSIIILNGNAAIEHRAFYDCDNLKRVYVRISDLAKYCTSNQISEIPGSKHLYLDGKEITNLVIPNSVTSIEYHAFKDCTSLTSITLPKSLTLIGAEAFYGCTALKAVYLNATIPPYLGKEVFDYDVGRICCPIYVPSSSLSRYKGVGGNWRSYYQYLRGR